MAKDESMFWNNHDQQNVFINGFWYHEKRLYDRIENIKFKTQPKQTSDKLTDFTG